MTLTNSRKPRSSSVIRSGSVPVDAVAGDYVTAYDGPRAISLRQRGEHVL